MAANVGVSTVVFASLQGGPIAMIAVASGILVDFIWKYAAPPALCGTCPTKAAPVSQAA